MRTYEVTYTVEDVGCGVVKETVQAASDFNARRLVEAKYQPKQVRIYDSRLISHD